VRSLVIAIDGPAASGKSTTAKLLGLKLGLLPVDTGAMYRAITLKVIRAGIDPQDLKGIERILEGSTISQKVVNGEVRTILDGEDVTEEIRTPEVSNLVSLISSYSVVRRKLVEIQRGFAKLGGIVVEGRDIGTVVFPDADLKVFMTADLRERAKRRQKELEEKGVKKALEEVMRELEERDHLDSTRDDSPLRIAPGAFVLDTTNLTISEQVEAIVEEIKRRFGDRDP
jgi:cytidylate kinase